jgi:Mrp family chromosome partitioning ATPase/HAMP domain-containing protein
MTGYLGMDLPRFFALLRARRGLIASVVVGAVALAVGVSLAQPDRYTAKADLLFGRTTNADAIIAGAPTETTQLPERVAATNLALASLDTVAEHVAGRFDGISVRQLKNAVSIKAAGESDLVTVTAEWGSPTQAAAVANAFATEIANFRRDGARAEIQRAIDALKATMPAVPPGTPPSDEVRAIQGRVSQLEALKALQTGNVQIVEQATPPEHRSSPTPVRTGLIAALVALLLAVFLVVLLARFDDRISEEHELTALMGLSVLTRIPELDRAERLGRARNGHPPAFTEAFEFLRLNLELLGHDGDSVVVAVTSPAADDGKTTVAAGLAQSLATSGSDVLAVDLDLRKPELHSYFNASSTVEGGVLDALLESGYAANGDADLDSAMQQLQDRTEPQSHGHHDPMSAGRAHTEEDVAIGLVELARSRGHVRRAVRSLRASGRDIPESTLRRWKEVHAEVYDDLRAESAHGVPVAPHLRLLAGNYHRPMPTGLIARARLKMLFDELRQGADYVVVDTVPVSTVADASAVAAAADGVILVVDLNQARRRDLLAAKKQLANARANVFGMVVNRAHVGLPIYHVHDDGRTRERTLG